MTVAHSRRAERPTLHFTPPQHWLNDPHGICWADGRYHLFYQHNPAGSQWAPGIAWGHATSTDLLRWEHQPVALAPRAGEVGCWSGSTMIEDGRPTIFYTSVAGDLDRGQIAVAHPDRSLQHWTSSPADVVVASPPPSLDVHSFRDPCLLSVDGGWAMIVGVGVESGDGLAVQYVSADGRDWTYDGVLCRRPSGTEDGLWTGNMWECPQLFRVGDDWVLVVSAWHDHQLLYCVAAVGDYDGHRFRARTWSRLSHDAISYAMTSFTDRDGRPCVMFWVREDSQQDPAVKPWAGAESLPMIVSVNPDGTVRLDPHPNLDRLRPSAPTVIDVSGGTTVGDALRGLDVCVTVESGSCVELALRHESTTSVRISVDASSQSIRVTDAGGVSTSVPRHGTAVRVVIDAGILTIFAGRGCATFRYPSDRPADLVLSGGHRERVTVARLGLDSDADPDTRDPGAHQAARESTDTEPARR